MAFRSLLKRAFRRRSLTLKCPRPSAEELDQLALEVVAVAAAEPECAALTDIIARILPEGTSVTTIRVKPSMVSRKRPPFAGRFGIERGRAHAVERHRWFRVRIPGMRHRREREESEKGEREVSLWRLRGGRRREATAAEPVRSAMVA